MQVRLDLAPDMMRAWATEVQFNTIFVRTTVPCL